MSIRASGLAQYQLGQPLHSLLILHNNVCFVTERKRKSWRFPFIHNGLGPKYLTGFKISEQVYAKLRFLLCHLPSLCGASKSPLARVLVLFQASL